jgi:hypothetical protein
VYDIVCGFLLHIINTVHLFLVVNIILVAGIIRAERGHPKESKAGRSCHPSPSTGKEQFS